MASKQVHDYMVSRLTDAKTTFERALDCKHTGFDDLYPYMTEHPQFFWYKRYVAWAELLTIVNVSEGLNIEWKSLFTPKQSDYITLKVMSASVLDYWYGVNKTEPSVQEQNP